MEITWAHLESVWNPSGPSEVPLHKPVTGQELFCAVSYAANRFYSSLNAPPEIYILDGLQSKYYCFFLYLFVWAQFHSVGSITHHTNHCLACLHTRVVWKSLLWTNIALLIDFLIHAVFSSVFSSLFLLRLLQILGCLIMKISAIVVENR